MNVPTYTDKIAAKSQIWHIAIFKIIHKDNLLREKFK